MLKRFYTAVFARIDATQPWLPGLAARLVFLAVLAPYYWAAGLTKFDGHPFALSDGAYAQILPKAFEAAGYNSADMGLLAWLIVLIGSWAEMILPLLIVLGLLTRPAALAMIGFILVQSLVDITGHGVDAATIGAWFDRAPDAAILDQRALWVFLLLYLGLYGAGRVSLDGWRR